MGVQREARNVKNRMRREGHRCDRSEVNQGEIVRYVKDSAGAWEKNGHSCRVWYNGIVVIKVPGAIRSNNHE
jgi:hypothetical protein